MYHVNWRPALGGVVVLLSDFVLEHVAKLEFDTPVKGHPGYRLKYRPTGVVMFEGVDIAYAVRKTIAEQLLLDQLKKDPELGVQHPGTDDVLESFGVTGPAN
jgi:hypothetical protein